jgi:hypothetical protein
MSLPSQLPDLLAHSEFQEQAEALKGAASLSPECPTQVPQSLSGSTSYSLDAREPNLVIEPLPCLVTGKTRFWVMLKQRSQL